MSPSRRSLLIATGNRHKLMEIADILSGDSIHILGLADVAEVEEPDEDQDSFAGNAQLKASAYARATGYPALADDSGLCVDALDGAPGIHSSRYAAMTEGAGSGDEANNALLLERMREVAEPARRAAFVCAMCLTTPGGEVVAAVEGRVAGVIVDACYGPEGFGYDPLFRPDGHTLTFGQLPPEIKRGISHRTNALRAMRPHIETYFGEPPK